MKTTKMMILAGIYTISLSGCVLFEESSHTTYRSYGYDSPEYVAGDSAGHSGGQASSTSTNQTNNYRSRVTHTPVRHRSQDKTWVNSQNPMGYTIELADGDTASDVAGQVHQAPKSGRSAQIQYERGGKSHYKGVFGSFQSKEAAKQAYDSLPDTVKSGAKVKSWGSVQGSVNH